MAIVFLLLQFVLLILAQKLVFGNLTLWSLAYADVSVLFVLFYPMAISKTIGLITQFCFGLVLDFFLPSYGMHAFTMVLLYMLRPYWVAIITPMARYNADEPIDIQGESESISWLLSYTFPLTTAFMLVFFLIADVGLDFYGVLKVLASSVYSGIFVFLIALLFYRGFQKKR